MTMPDYLSSKDRRAVLDQREHKTVKKTGVSDTLDDDASAKKKDDLRRMVSAPERIVAKANEVKTAQSKFPKIKAFLDETVKAAKIEEQKPAPRVARLAETADTDADDSTLGKALTRVRQIGPDNAWNFVLVPGRPSSGPVVTRKTLKKSDTDIEPIEEGEGPTGPAPLTGAGHLGAFNARVQQVRAAAQRFAPSANAEVPGAAHGICGAISMLRQQSAADTKLGNAAKTRTASTESRSST
jgi:hypothetical protein